MKKAFQNKKHLYKLKQVSTSDQYQVRAGYL